jgi:Skp family chaperone for outer membrane proteins
MIEKVRRILKVIDLANEKLAWTSSVGPREEEAAELAQRLEELSRRMDAKIEETQKDLDSLETTLQDEKSTYLTFQKIK